MAEIPDIWKKALIILIMKLSKLADEDHSNKLVSFLCPAAKVLEHLAPLPSSQRSTNPQQLSVWFPDHAMHHHRQPPTINISTIKF